MPTKRNMLRGQSMQAECSWFIFLAVLSADAEAICLKGNQCSWLLNKLIFTGQCGSWSRAFKILVLSPVHHKSANLDTFLNHQVVETIAFIYIAIICPNSKTRKLCTKLSRHKDEFWRQKPFIQRHWFEFIMPAFSIGGNPIKSESHYYGVN